VIIDFRTADSESEVLSSDASLTTRLLEECARVVAKRMRWRRLAVEVGPRRNFIGAIDAMSKELKTAEDALVSGDRLHLIAALESLRSFHEED
jgi:hypothetical protein